MKYEFSFNIIISTWEGLRGKLYVHNATTILIVVIVILIEYFFHFNVKLIFDEQLQTRTSARYQQSLRFKNT